MQVMPATARYIASRSALEPPRQDDLFEPETSIRFGQAYLEHLLQRSADRRQSDLRRGGLQRRAGQRRPLARAPRRSSTIRCCSWNRSRCARPRDYVKKVLTNLWSYRARLGQPQPSLEALARNRVAELPRARSRSGRCMPGIDQSRPFRPLNIARADGLRQPLAGRGPLGRSAGRAADRGRPPSGRPGAGGRRRRADRRSAARAGSPIRRSTW